MKVVVSAQGPTLDSPTSPVFGRCPTLMFVDTETLEFKAMDNPAMNESGGAGIQAAQFVVGQGAQAVITGNLGPNAFDVLQAAGVPGYLTQTGTIGQAVQAYKAGDLQQMRGASVSAHAGLGRGSRRAPSRPPETKNPGREAELAELRETLKSLRQQLAETMNRIEKLEQEG
ncbi:MAG: NifB/NifX family molybdenum-iron cluster-binding protein [Anaerolineae bacterium]